MLQAMFKLEIEQRQSVLPRLVTKRLFRLLAHPLRQAEHTLAPTSMQVYAITTKKRLICSAIQRNQSMPILLTYRKTTKIIHFAYRFCRFSSKSFAKMPKLNDFPDYVKPSPPWDSPPLPAPCMIPVMTTHKITRSFARLP